MPLEDIERFRAWVDAETPAGDPADAHPYAPPRDELVATHSAHVPEGYISTAEASDDAARPDVVGDRYVLGTLLGEGGMGVVVEATDRRLGRTVALKLLKRSASAEVNERVRREARAVAQLSHPNEVQVFDVGMHDGAPYIVMELVPDEPLRTWQSAAPRPRWRTVLRAYRHAGAGLAAAHDAGRIHRAAEVKE